MQRLISVLAVWTLVLGVAATAHAQRTPYTGMSAVGVNVGAASPSAEGIDAGISPTGSYEYYMTPRASMRLQGGAAWNDFSHASSTMRPAFLDVNGVYNWEGGAWHPFATAGVGVYHYNFRDFGISATKPGLNAGGGIEYFFTRLASIKGEVLYHGVAGRAFSPFGPVKTSFWTTSIGFKRYF